jgi:hypothetical protein
MNRSGSGGSNAQCSALRGHCTVLRLPAMSSVSSARFQWAVGRGVQAVASLKGCSPSTQHMPYTLACSCRWRPRGREALAQAREGALLQMGRHSTVGCARIRAWQAVRTPNWHHSSMLPSLIRFSHCSEQVVRARTSLGLQVSECAATLMSTIVMLQTDVQTNLRCGALRSLTMVVY